MEYDGMSVEVVASGIRVGIKGSMTMSGSAGAAGAAAAGGAAFFLMTFFFFLDKALHAMRQRASTPAKANQVHNCNWKPDEPDCLNPILMTEPESSEVKGLLFKEAEFIDSRDVIAPDEADESCSARVALKWIFFTIFEMFVKDMVKDTAIPPFTIFEMLHST